MSTISTNLASGTTNLAISGLASGFDWQSLVSQLVQVERQPEQLLQAQQTTLQQKNTALSTIATELTTFQNDITTLNAPSFFDSRTASSSDSSLANASVTAGAPLGTYTFDVSQLATAAKWQGSTGAGAKISQTDNAPGVTLQSAGFATPVTAGTFTINGQQITVATTDTLQSVFAKIQTATQGASQGTVTATYSTANDKITLSSTGTIVLGSATDTSNFLQVAKLINSSLVPNSNGTSSLSSTAALGAVNVSGAMNQSNLATPVNDGGGNGAFMINGVKITFSASKDSISDVLNRINESGAESPPPMTR